MEDMEIVIKIPKSVYNYVKQLGNIPTIDTQCVANAIFDGIPLPKGHGRLIDADALKNEWKNGFHKKIVDALMDDAPTIIEAESEE